MAAITSKNRRTISSTATSRNRLLALILVGLALLGTLIFWEMSRQPGTLFSLSRMQPISADALAADYGLQVKLIGVTAGGGMVDVRFKVLDVTKAAVLLKDPANLPQLFVQGTALTIAPDDLNKLILEKDGIVFLLYSNRGGVVKPNTPVTIQFGKLNLATITAQ